MPNKRYYYPDKILDTKSVGGKMMYLIKWKNYKTTTWEPHEHIAHRDDLIDEYEEKNIDNVHISDVGYIYCRVSTKEQSKYNAGHTSLNVQEKECKSYCEDSEVKVLDIVKEVSSARNMKQMKGLRNIVQRARGGQTIYVYDISRFSRNIRQALNLLDELREKNINVYSVFEKMSYSDISTRNQFRIQLCSSSYMSELCSMKVKESIKYRRARGDYIGSVRYGYKAIRNEDGVRVKIECTVEQKVIKLLFKLFRRYGGDYDRVLQKVKKDGIKFRNRNATISGIKRIIKMNK